MDLGGNSTLELGLLLPLDPFGGVLAHEAPDAVDDVLRHVLERVIRRDLDHLGVRVKG